jgi:flagellar export protein FliJ
MMPKTRLDKLVMLREKEEGDALAHLGRARAQVQAARDRLERAVCAAQTDGRGHGRAALWQLEEAAHRRALQSLRAAQGEVSAAVERQESASSGYREARQDAETMRRAAGRMRAELKSHEARRERRAADEVATLRFNLR